MRKPLEYLNLISSGIILYFQILFYFISPGQRANYFHYCNKWIGKNLQFLVLLLNCVKSYIAQLFSRIISRVWNLNLDNAASIFWVYMAQVQHILLRWISHKRLFFIIKISPIINFSYFAFRVHTHFRHCVYVFPFTNCNSSISYSK